MDNTTTLTIPDVHLCQFEYKGKTYVALVRKLIELEAFRLMGVDDKDAETIINSGIARTACYKLAGNSIVVDVLYGGKSNHRMHRLELTKND